MLCWIARLTEASPASWGQHQLCYNLLHCQKGCLPDGPCGEQTLSRQVPAML